MKIVVSDTARGEMEDIRRWIYAVTSDRIEVLNVHHGARDTPDFSISD